MTGFLVYVLTSQEFDTARQPDLLRTLTSMTETALIAKIGAIVTGATTVDNPEFIDDGTYRRFLTETLAHYGMMVDQTFTGMASSVAKDTQWLSIPAVPAMVRGKSLTVSDLPKVELDIFIRMPGDLMKSYPGVCRTQIDAFMKVMEKAEGDYAKRVSLVHDEVDLLGCMSILEEARDRGRKYGAPALRCQSPAAPARGDRADQLFTRDHQPLPQCSHLPVAAADRPALRGLARLRHQHEVLSPAHDVIRTDPRATASGVAPPSTNQSTTPVTTPRQ